MKMTGSRVLALTAALTASSIFRESMCFSRYCCTDISCFFFLVLLCISFEIYNVCARNGFKIFLKNLFLYWKSGNLGSWEREREREREMSPNFADLVSGLGIGNLNSQETLLRYNLNLKTLAVRSSRGLRTFNSSLLWLATQFMKDHRNTEKKFSYGKC